MLFGEMAMEKEILSEDEAAVLCDVSRITLARLRKAGTPVIPYIMFGDVPRYSRTAVLEAFRQMPVVSEQQDEKKIHGSGRLQTASPKPVSAGVKSGRPRKVSSASAEMNPSGRISAE
jgi:hypothetical protein